jgi:hypothetical protein
LSPRSKSRATDDISIHFGTHADKTEWLNRWAANDPQNGAAKLVLAGRLLKDGQTSEAMALFNEGIKKSTFDLGWQSHTVAAQEAWMAVGKSPLEARVLAAGAVMIPFYSYLQCLAKAVASDVRRLASENRHDEALQLAGQNLAFARQLNADPSRKLDIKLVADSIEVATLKALPPDTEIGSSGQTAAERCDELRRERTSFPGDLSLDIAKVVPELSNPEIASYFQRLDLMGEAAALEWLRQRLDERRKTE